MKKTFFLASVCGLLFLAGCGSTSSAPISPAIQTSTVTTIISGYTMQEVQQHKTASDCRTVINGKIYDMSAFASRHSGGANPILAVCGKDGTAIYAQQHGTNYSLIQSFFIATLQ